MCEHFHAFVPHRCENTNFLLRHRRKKAQIYLYRNNGVESSETNQLEREIGWIYIKWIIISALGRCIKANKRPCLRRARIMFIPSTDVKSSNFHFGYYYYFLCFLISASGAMKLKFSDGRFEYRTSVTRAVGHGDPIIISKKTFWRAIFAYFLKELSHTLCQIIESRSC